MKKPFAILVVIALVLTSLCSCSVANSDGTGQSEAAGETKSISVFVPAWDPANEDMDRNFRAAAQIFTEVYGIEVERYPSPDINSFLSGSEDIGLYRDKLFAEIMAGNGPDVFISGSGGIFSDIYKKMDAGAFYDLNEFIENDDEFDISEYEQGILDAGVYKGSRYFLPLSYIVPTLVTSGEKLASTGLTADDFSTYERFMTSWEYLQQNVNMRLYNDKGGWRSLVSQTGWLSECVDFETGTMGFDLSSFRRVMDLFKTEYQLEEYGTVNNDTPFVEGEVYSDRLFIWQSFVDGFLIRPDIYGIGAEDLVMMPVPNAEGVCTAKIQDFCMISSATKNADAAWDFVKILLSDEVQLETMDRMFGITVKTKYIDDSIDAQFSNPNYSNPYDDKFIDRVKANYHGYDNVFLSYSEGDFWKKVSEYAESEDQQSFDAFKAEIENYYRIFMSE